MLLRSGKRGLTQSNSTRQSSSMKKRKLSDESSVTKRGFTPQIEQTNKTPTTQNIKSPISLPYMGLSAEIWCQICLLVAKQENTVRVHFHRILRPSFRPSQTMRLPDSKTLLSLASTCRWMYKEATQIYYSKNVFRVFQSNMENFLDSVTARNFNLITSLEILNCGHIVTPWQTISTMTSIRNISVYYPDAVWFDHFAKVPNQKHYPASREFIKFIDCLSTFSHEKGEQLGGFIHTASGYTHAVVPKKDWDLWEVLYNNSATAGVSRKVTYSWGVVTGCIDSWNMTINIERHGRAKI